MAGRADSPVFLITGATAASGETAAGQAVDAGYRVVLAARAKERLADLAADLGGEDRALAVRCDVTEWADQEALVRRALDLYGRIDVAFANAGYGGARGFQAETPEHWRGMVLTNVLGVAYTIRATMDALREARGHLLITSSV